jgi:hypothetical protein
LSVQLSPALTGGSLPWGSSSAIFQPFGHGKGSSDFALSHRRPRRSFLGKKPLLNGRKDGINTFFRRETFFLFSCWSCSRRLRGEIGRAEDPFLPVYGRKKLAEAGPPGKRPAEAKARKCLRMYKKHFITSLETMQLLSFFFYSVEETNVRGSFQNIFIEYFPSNFSP